MFIYLLFFFWLSSFIDIYIFFSTTFFFLYILLLFHSDTFFFYYAFFPLFIIIHQLNMNHPSLPLIHHLLTHLIHLLHPHPQPQTPTHLEDITEIIRKDTEKEQTKFETPSSAGTAARNQVGLRGQGVGGAGRVEVGCSGERED